MPGSMVSPLNTNTNEQETQQMTTQHPILAACTTVQLVDEAIRRIDLVEVERILGLSVAELQRRAEDFDAAMARHPVGKGIERARALAGLRAGDGRAPRC
jgi:hypothetical protein